MNRLYRTFLLLLVTLPSILHAQVGDHRNDLSVGFNGGYTMSNVGFSPNVPQSQLGGFTAGATIRYTCEKYFKSICAIVAEVNLTQMGWKESITDQDDNPVIGTVAAAAYLLMTVSSVGLPATDHPNHVADVTPNLLITTYLTLTFAELLLSPIGISLVTKVAPPKYKGLMMGGWFVSTALGNKLVSIPGHMWGMDLTIVWGTLMCICLVAALFIFLIVKKLNKVC